MVALREEVVQVVATSGGLTPEVAMRLIGDHLRSNALPEARRLAEALVAEHPGFARGWVSAAMIAFRSKQAAQAAQFINQACKVDPSDPLVNAYAARIFAQTGNLRRARACGEAVLRNPPGEAELLDFTGNALSMCGDQVGARRCFEAAVALAPRVPSFLFNLAATERFAGDFDAAREHMEMVVTLEPSNWDAHYGLSYLRRQTHETSHVSRLESLLGRPEMDWRGEVRIRYALGKEYDDLGESERAFQYYSGAAKIQRTHTKYTPEEEIATIDEIIQTHTATAFSSRPAGTSDASPVFILGLPRTGSTLVERILDAHPDIASKGELNEWVVALMSVAEQTEGRGSDSLVERTLEVDFDRLGKAYLARVAEHAPDTARFIDKMPLNSLYVGLILQALPHARIIYLERDPLDAAMAIYTTLFSRAYPWSYDLEEVSGYMVAHARLMNHWRKEFPGRILSVAYEDFVFDQAASTRRLLEYCRLSWHDACLQFHQSRSASTTASAVDVRRPIYSSSVGRGENFLPFIGSQLDGVLRLRQRYADERKSHSGVA